MLNTILKFIFLGLSLCMVYLVVVTSMKSDMFNLPEPVLKEPWFWTTLVDFYFNILILSVWVIYKENSIVRSAVWILSFISLGSIATCFYVFLQLATLKKGEGVAQVLLRRKV